MKKLISILFLLITFNIHAQQKDSLDGWHGIPFGVTKEFVKEQFNVKYPKSIIEEETKNRITFSGDMLFAGYKAQVISFEFINNKFFSCNIGYRLIDAPSPTEIEKILNEKYHKVNRFDTKPWLIEYWDFFNGNQISMMLVGSENLGIQLSYKCGLLFEEWKNEQNRKDNERKQITKNEL